MAITSPGSGAWYPDGGLQRVEYYENNERAHTWTWYNREGKRVKQKSYSKLKMLRKEYESVLYDASVSTPEPLPQFPGNITAYSEELSRQVQHRLAAKTKPSRPMHVEFLADISYEYGHIENLRLLPDAYGYSEGSVFYESLRGALKAMPRWDVKNLYGIRYTIKISFDVR